MSKHVKNQHTVSRFLLNYFSSKRGHLWCFDKQYNQIREKGIGGVAYEEYFYDKQPGQKEGSHEYSLQKAETEAAPVIKKIVELGSLQSLTHNEKNSMARFIYLQLSRTKTSQARTKEVNALFVNKVAEWFAEAIGVPSFDIEDTTSRQLWLDALEDVEDRSEIIMRKNWVLGTSDNPLYISDHPVVKRNIVNQSSVRGTTGLASPGVEIYFPLTPSIIICLFCEKEFTMDPGTVCKLSAKDVQELNELQTLNADRFVFSSSNNLNLAKKLMDGI